MVNDIYNILCMFCALMLLLLLTIATVKMYRYDAAKDGAEKALEEFGFQRKDKPAQT